MTEKDNPVMAPRDAKTFPQLIRSAAAAYGDAIAATLLDDAGREESLGFSELDEKSALLARGLIARGVGKGTRVGFIYGNGPSFALIFAAIARAGGIAIPISTFLRGDELVRVLRQSDIAGLIVQRSLLGKDYVERLSQALPVLAGEQGEPLLLAEVPFLRWIVSDGEALPVAIHPMSWITDVAGRVSEALLREVEAEIHPTDQMMEIYTSGSMALPKGVRHNHGPTMFRAHYIGSKLELRAGQETTVPLPLFWVGGMIMYLLPNWACGAVTHCTEGTSTNSRFAMGVVLADDDARRLPANKVSWALGMTETLGPYSYGDQARVAGYPLCAPLDHIADGFEVRVVDADGRPVGEGETGEIQVRGHALTPGLHKVEKSRYFTADGFYRTGDMGTVEGERILFVGRDGDMIKTVGSNVSPAEVELEMQRLPAVHSAYVVGIPDSERGQLVVAAVVPREGETLDVEGIRKTLSQRLSSYKVPREYVVISRDEVPMLPSNKVSRRGIAALVAERLGKTTT